VILIDLAARNSARGKMAAKGDSGVRSTVIGGRFDDISNHVAINKVSIFGGNQKAATMCSTFFLFRLPVTPDQYQRL
jgi:hypothetical protein